MEYGPVLRVLGAGNNVPSTVQLRMDAALVVILPVVLLVFVPIVCVCERAFLVLTLLFSFASLLVVVALGLSLSLAQFSCILFSLFFFFCYYSR